MNATQTARREPMRASNSSLDEELLQVPTWMRWQQEKTTPQPDHASPVLVVGLGGAGTRFVEWLQHHPIDGADCIAVDTHAANGSPIERAGRRVREKRSEREERGIAPLILTLNTKSAEWDRLSNRISPYKAIVLHVGLGGGGGSKLVPLIAKAVRRAGLLPTVHATTPFRMEGNEHTRCSEKAVLELKRISCPIFTFSNESNTHLPLEDGFELVRQLYREEVIKVAEPYLSNNLDHRGKAGTD
ncbi:MAG: hypothetical protein HN842_01215 [Gammaproteobacteria bacterium]|nr:hypothetical protein [Gammaproteobacteria bacterium]